MSAAIAAVTVGSVLVGGAIAYQREPHTDTDSAAPLAASPDLPTTRVDLTQLPTGRAPQLAYLSGRVVKGGLGSDVAVPGRQQILRAVRYDGDALVLLQSDSGSSELVRFSHIMNISPEHTAAVASLVTSVDEDAVAYGTARITADGAHRQGNAVYWRNAFADNKLDRPDDWASTVLAVVGQTVYFAASTDRDGKASTLNAWHTQTGKVDLLKSFKSPAGVDFQGTRGINRAVGTTCSSVLKLADGNELWRTCKYSLNGFTPDGQSLIAVDSKGIAAIDTSSGAVRRQWTGPRFLSATTEDDDHLLMVAGTGNNTAIIRCSISSDACEVATPLTRGTAPRLMGAWS